ncbi:MAG: hypothetical protein RIA69_14450, partial [Cyclobacteriaceae bacterium]
MTDFYLPFTAVANRTRILAMFCLAFVTLFVSFTVSAQDNTINDSPGTAEKNELNPLNDASGSLFEVFDFSIVNTGASTTFTGITVNIGTSSISDWQGIIAYAEITDNDGTADVLAGTIGANTISFATTTGTDELGEIGASETKVYTMSIYFNSAITGIIDNQVLAFSVDEASFTGITGGTFATSSAINTADATSEITVTAAALKFQSLSNSVQTGINFDAEVEAVDANGNRDIDITSTITLSVNTGGGTLAGTTAVDASAGIATFNAVNFDTGSDGVKTLAANDGALTEGISGNINLDNTAPTVILSDNEADNIVKDGDVVSITATFTEANGLGSNIPEIQIGSEISSAVSMSGSGLVWTYSWTVGSVNGGLNETANITITVNDAAGNANTAATGETSFVIDNTAPTVILSDNEADNIVKDGDVVSITATFTEANGLGSNTPQIQIGSDISSAVGMSGSGLVWTYSWTVGSGNGSLNETANITITVNDAAGNANIAATGETSFVIDNTAPTVILSDNEADNIVKDGDVVSITATFTDANGLGSNTPQIEIGSDISSPVSMTGSGLVWTYSWTVGSVNNGLNETANITITVNDAAGNANTATTGETSFVIDNTAPTVILSDNEADNIVKDGDVVSITATFTEANGLGANTPQIEIGSDISSPVSMTGSGLVWTYSWTVGCGNGVLNETANITITVNDAAGKSNTPATGETSFVIDNTAPTVILSDNEADNIVKDGDVVSITATFTEANGLGSNIPEIQIGSDISSPVSMSGSGLVWTYSWTVGSVNNGLNETAN